MEFKDQAAGLRRLCAPEQIRSISFSAGRASAGTSSIVINLSMALIHQGLRVLIIDEFSGNGNVASRLGLSQRYDLNKIISQKLPLDELIMDGPEGMMIMPLPTNSQKLTQLSSQDQQRITHDFTRITQMVDLILVDSQAASSEARPSLSLAASDCVIVVNNDAISITEAYASIKRLARDFAKHEFRMLINRVDTLDEARAVHQRISDVAQHYLGVNIRLMGFVPDDIQLHQANRLLTPITHAFPEADATQAFYQLAQMIQGWPSLNNQVTAASHRFVQQLIEGSKVLLSQHTHHRAN